MNSFSAFFPILSLVGLIGYGLMARPLLLRQPPIPLEIVFLTAAALSVCQLFVLGYSWETIQTAMIRKIRRGLPAVFILFCIGIVIGSWIVAGTIPMLIYYGIKVIDPTWIYLVAFLVSAVFSTVSGTSWGSAGTIGVVVIGVATVIDANLAITAGAVVGGSFFGDKLSPLSDTTNVAALSAEVDLYDHIRSMLNTTIPAAIVAVVLYAVMGFIYPPRLEQGVLDGIEPSLTALEEIFQFNIFLLIPAVVVVIGALKRWPTVPVLLGSSASAIIVALLFQGFSATAVIQTVYKGFDLSMATWFQREDLGVVSILNRGGLYELSEPIMITFIVFVFTGSLEVIDAMPRVVEKVFRWARTQRSTVVSALAATAFTNAMTSNQFATSFIVGDAFRARFDRLGIPRKVLSRSLEDTGTMLENLLPWTTTGIYMATTLGVAVSDYWNWQFLSLANFVVAVLLAVTGKGCFYDETSAAALCTSTGGNSPEEEKSGTEG